MQINYLFKDESSLRGFACRLSLSFFQSYGLQNCIFLCMAYLINAYIWMLCVMLPAETM